MTWPETEGVVTGTTTASDQAAQGTRPTSYFPYVRFEYQVDGQDYWNSGGQLEQSIYKTREEAEEAAQYKEGDTIPVYYKPTNPQISYLVRGAGGVSLVRLIASAVIGVIGVLLFFLWKATKE